MDLGRKLASLSNPAPPTAQSQQARLATLRARLDALQHSPRQTRVVPDPPASPPEPYGLPGARRDTEYGELYSIDSRFSADHRHGHTALAPATAADSDALATLLDDEAVRGLEWRRLLYLDTETTGLWGGSGTLSFLIGLGGFSDGAFSVEQLLLCRPGHEEPMLRRLAERLDKSSGIVTYNGKGFDWPLLRNRFIMNRVPLPQVACHLDLLPASRRLFCYRLGAFNLVEVEEQILGKARTDDVAGADIPELYWRFQRTGDGRLLEPILAHNLDDVVALAALLGRLGAVGGASIDATEMLGRARISFRRRDFDAALGLARRAAEAGALPARGWCFVARLERRFGEAERAIAAWQRALTGGPLSPRATAEANLALAKLFEHALRDYERATAHAHQTLRIEGRATQARRLARLARRRQRQA